MRVSTGNPGAWPDATEGAAVTVGVFDGVHLGHRSLIGLLDGEDRRTVLTFDPHPVEVLRPGTHPRLLTTIEERLRLLEGLGLDHVGVLDLSDIKEMQPLRFVEDVLVVKAGMRRLVSGADFRFGKDRVGDVALLESHGDRLGFVVEVAPFVEDSGGVVSSSRIREMIEHGRPDAAADAMGSSFQVTGAVVRGDRRGRDLGFPTANLEPPSRKVTPGIGVYAGRADVKGDSFLAAINVGVRPTFGTGQLVVEAYLLDFDHDIYGETISVFLDRFLRPEVAFGDVADLVDQMGRDVAEVRSLNPGWA
jgi:riboflavin kinase / FMN adenylyltransferase